MELAAERFMEAAQGHWVLSSQEEHSCDSFAERVQPSNWSAYDSVFEEPGFNFESYLRRYGTIATVVDDP